MIVNSLQELYRFFQYPRPVISVDYGSKKLGSAVSSPDYNLSLPLKLIVSDSDKDKVTQIINILKEIDPCALVIGLPINMDGSLGPQTLSVKKFANKILGRINIPIYFQDERLTSKAADNYLKNLGINRKNRNNIDDLTAACMILETTLSSVKKMLEQKTRYS